MKVHIVRIVEEWDMREKHRLREGRNAKRLHAGEVLLAFNRALDMARFIDCEGGVHDYYADDRVRFDVDELRRMIHRGFHVDLEVGRSEIARAHELSIAA